MANLSDEIDRIIQMKEEGHLSEAQYEQMKTDILSQHKGTEPPVKKSRIKNDETDWGLYVGAELRTGKNTYKISKHLGKGGMGEVWQVDDINYSKRQQETQYKAIKVLPIDLAHSQDHLDLLSDEADLTAELKHSHIINVFGLAESEGSDNKAGIPFILMEYLEGKTLEQYLLNQGVLTWEQAEKWLNQAAGALDYAWTKHHLIHRDLKPGNLFITEDQELILLDFGLAWRIRKSQLSLSNQEVDDSSSRGTVAYMPPEAFANTAPDPRQDVYALACVCYQMLTGETPYPPEAARQRDPELYPDAPKQLNKTAWEILKQGFAYNKAQRPKTAGELIETLKAAQTKQEKVEVTKPSKPIPETPTPPENNNEDNQRVKRNIWIIGLIVGLLVTLSYTVLERNKIAQKRAEQATQSNATETDSDTGMELVYIKAGQFKMGSPKTEVDRRSDEQQHLIHITKGYYLGKYEVTQRQWKKFMGNNPAHFKSCGLDCPVEQVSWNDIQTFIKKLNQQTGKHYRLPTEAEWEYAARAGTSSVFSFGDNITPAQVNYDGDHPYNGAAKGKDRDTTVKVGSLPANAWGLHEMHGNVWEWVQDRYEHGYYKSSPKNDPQGPAGGSSRVCRGGSWSLGARSVRSANRPYIRPSLSRRNLGFRLARTN